MADEGLARSRRAAALADEAARAHLIAALGATAAGNRAQFEQLYRRTCAKLFGICLRILPDRTDAEEALQETYIAIWRRAGTFDPGRGGAMSWLIAVARNCAIDRARAVGSRALGGIAVDETIADPAPDAALVAESDEESRRLTDCLAALRSEDAGLIRTAFFADTPYSELARRAELPLGTVKSRIRRALIQLRECLE